MKKLLFFPFLLLLAGCWDTNQAERMYYIHGLGFDYKDEEYKIYAQIIDFTNIAKSEQPNPEATQVEVGIANGRTFDEAFFNLYNSMDERLFFGHLSYVIFSENIVKENKAQPIVNAFIRYRELRYTTWAYVTNSSIDEIMSTTPILNKSITLSKLSDPLNSFSQSSLIRPIRFRELMIQLDEPSHEAHIPFVEVKENWTTNKGEDTIHGFSGMSIISKKSGLKGTIPLDQARGLQFMTDKTKRSSLTVKYPALDDPYITLNVDKVKPEIIPIVTKDGVQFDITVKIIVTANEFPAEENEDKFQDAVKKEMKHEIEKTYKAGLEQDIDIYRLSEVVYRKELKAWKKFQNDGKIPLNESSIRTLNIDFAQIKGERIITEKGEYDL
ncbi:Ger(x)C family spore germination protein [Solibacillus sp. FSL R7-0682]|uniref:Ger(x)C family spore germination protein n=1 Tax=Solibacillus sp. FSL R7-0682 TaxID=2921690 RepID=UPI0030FB3BC2